MECQLLPCEMVYGVLVQIMFNCHSPVFLIDWISDTRSQGYTDLQCLVKCLDHRGIVLDTVCSQARVVSGCAMH